MTGIGVALSLTTAPDQEASTVPDPPPTGPLAIQNTPEGSLEIMAQDGTLLVTLLAPSPFAGTYTITTDLLADGPVNLVAPQITGTPSTGQTLSVIPGLWLYDSAHAAPLAAYQWLWDGTPLPGETGLSSVAPGSGVAVSVIETLTQFGKGSRSITSMIWTI